MAITQSKYCLLYPSKSELIVWLFHCPFILFSFYEPVHMPQCPKSIHWLHVLVPQMCLPGLYKYWPLPTCVFSSLIITSLLLVISVLSKLSKNSLFFQARMSAPIIPQSSSVQAPADLQLITTQHQLIIRLTSYTPEVILLHPKTFSQRLVHSSHLVMALTK